VFYEIHKNMNSAIRKQIKTESRKNKLKLIEDINPM
jgi:predicted GIY-YIG superfamily endonuclease